MNDLNSETKSYKSMNLNNNNYNLVQTDNNVSTVENNETADINFQNLMNSENFGQNLYKNEDSILKDVNIVSNPPKFYAGVGPKANDIIVQPKRGFTFLKKKDSQGLMMIQH